MNKYELSIIIYISLFLVSCKSNINDLMLERLINLDILIEEDLESTSDSLKQIQYSKLNKFNKAYYGLIKTIVDDKYYMDFKNDSLIQESQKYFYSYNNGTDLHIRSLIYQGIVLYRIGVRDSTAFIPLKYAESLYSKQTNQSTSTGWLMYCHLGKIHSDKTNYSISNNYYLLALNIALKENNPSRIFDTKLALFWNNMKMERFDSAYTYLQELEESQTKSIDEEYYLLNASSAYLSFQNNHMDALNINKKRIKLIPHVKDKPDIFRSYYSICDDYLNLGMLDSAMIYIEKSIAHVTDTNYVLNYLLYEKAAHILEMQGNYVSANSYIKESVEIRNKTVSKEIDISILELETKYNHAESENKALRAEATTRAAALIILILILCIVLLINHLNRKRRKNKIEKDIIENEKKTIELNKKISEAESTALRIENEKLELTNKVYGQMLNQFFILENELRKIADKSKLSNPDFAEKIEELRNIMSKSLIEKFDEEITSSKFWIMTGIYVPTNLNKSERFMLFLIYCNISNSNMAIILKTSPSSVRSRKSILKNKLLISGLDTSYF